MNSDLAADIAITKAQNRNYILGYGFHRLVSQSNSFALLLREESRTNPAPSSQPPAPSPQLPAPSPQPPALGCA